MMLVLTLLCRDEADILESMLRFHLAHGVDRIIATDNGSVDGSLEILQRFERRGQLTLLQEAEQTHDPHHGRWHVTIHHRTFPNYTGPGIRSGAGSQITAW